MSEGLIKRINCRYGTLVICYDSEFAARLLMLGEKHKKIHSRAEKYRNRVQKRGEVADMSGYWHILAAEFDRAFGDGACRIVFGGDMVSTDAMIEFFDKINPYLEVWRMEFELNGKI